MARDTRATGARSRLAAFALRAEAEDELGEGRGEDQDQQGDDGDRGAGAHSVILTDRGRLARTLFGGNDRDG